jgi:hypothetical protein
VSGDAGGWTGHSQGAGQEQLKRLMDRPALSDSDWVRNDKVGITRPHPTKKHLDSLGSVSYTEHGQLYREVQLQTSDLSVGVYWPP